MDLHAEKILLRSATVAEAEAYMSWMNDPEVTQYLGAIHERQVTLQEEIEFIEKMLKDPDELLFSVFLKDSDRLIGNCAIHYRVKDDADFAGETFLGIAIGDKSEWGKGYGTEVIALLLQYLKEQSGEKIYLTVDEENVAGQAVYKKCGFEVLKKRPRESGDGYEFVMGVV